jgi:hypothetical protein
MLLLRCVKKTHDSNAERRGIIIFLQQVLWACFSKQKSDSDTSNQLLRRKPRKAPLFQAQRSDYPNSKDEQRMVYGIYVVSAF